MAKLTLKDITSGFLATQTINDNNALIEALVETFLSRDGLAPNTMLDNFDMNSNRIINLAAPVAATDAIRLSDLQSASVVTQFPDQTGNAGRVVTTNGTILSWVGIESLFNPFMAGFLADTTAALAQTTLDVYSQAEVDSRDQDGDAVFAVDTGSPNSVVIAPTPVISAYQTGQKFRTVVAATNTGATTVTVNGISALPLNDVEGNALAVGALAVGQPLEFMLNTATEARLLSEPAVNPATFPIGWLQDPTITRTTADSFTVGAFQATSLATSVPIVATSSSITRQLTNLFQRATAGLAGIVENVGAFVSPAETTQTDITFITGPDRITAGSGTPFSAFVVGDKVIIDGSTSNDGIYDVTAATATTIDVGTTLTVEGAGASVSVYRVEQDITYHVHAVRQTATGTIDLAIDDTFDGTNIGTGASLGWTQVRRLWSFLTDASTDIEDFFKIGNWCEWVVVANDISTNSVAIQTVATKVPTGFSVLGHYVMLNHNVGSGGSGTTALSSGLRSAGRAAVAATNGLGNLTDAEAGFVAGVVPSDSASIFSATDTLGQIFTDGALTQVSNPTYNVWTVGYFDERKD